MTAKWCFDSIFGHHLVRVGGRQADVFTDPVELRQPLVERKEWDFCLRISTTLVAVFGSQYVGHASINLRRFARQYACSASSPMT
jgi:hypothetical protein